MSRQLEFSYRQGMSRGDVPRNITSVIVENGVTTIARRAFDNRFNENDRFDEEGDSIGYNPRLCDVNKYRHLGHAVIATSVTSIGHRAFFRCLKSVDIKGDPLTPSFLNHLGTAAFSGTYLRKIDLSHCPSLTALPAACFENSKLKIILLPPNLQGIGKRCFSYCEFTTIHLPESVQRIGEDSMYACFQLESLRIPAAARELGTNFLCICSELKAVQFESLASIGAMVGSDGTKPFRNNTSLHSIQWPPKTLPIALWPRVVYRLFLINGERSIFYDVGEAQKNRISCLFTSLCEHCEQILGNQLRLQALKRQRSTDDEA